MPGKIDSAVLAALGIRQERNVANLPFRLEGERLELSLEPDDEVDVRLTEIVCKEAGARFTFVNRIPDWSDGDARLWEVAGTLDGSRQEYLIGPGTGNEVVVQQAVGIDGEAGLLLLWSGIAIPHAEGSDEIWVAISVLVGDTDVVSRWRICVGRSKGASASLDRVTLLPLSIRGPITPSRGESHLDAQRYGRVVVPTAIQGQTPFHGNNEPLWFWMLTSARREFTHPGASHLFQFGCVYAGDPQDVESFRWILYHGTEDTTGHYKRFHYQGARGVGADGIEGYWLWRSDYYPPFGDMLADPEDPPPTEFGNTFASPYAVAVGGFRAKSDAFWYDVCEFYRGFVERAGIVGEPKETSRRLTDLARANPWFGFVVADLRPGRTIDADVSRWARFLELAVTWREGLRSEHLSVDPSFVYVWSAAPPPDSTEPGQGFDRESPTVLIPTTADLDMRVCPYAIPATHSEAKWLEKVGWEAFIPADALWYQRDGKPRIADLSGVINPVTGRPIGDVLITVDFGSPATTAYFAGVYTPRVLRTYGFSAMYCDLTLGPGPQLAYDPPPPLPRNHLAHGGDYWTQGKGRLLDAVRESVRIASRFASGSHIDEQAFVQSEGPEEFVADRADLTQSGLFWLPHHLAGAEEIIFGLALPGMPRVTRDMSLPLWSLVYSHWFTPGRLSVASSNIGLETNHDFYPKDGFPGMTAEEWVNMYAFTYGSIFIAGLKVLRYTDLSEDSPLVILDSGRLTVDTDKDPERTGLTILEMDRLLYSAQKRSFAGQFVVFGMRQRPLHVDESADPTYVANNPIAACRKTDVQRDGLWTFPALYSGFETPDPRGAWGTLDFPVERVIHSTWTSPEGRLGLILFNWSDTPARWSAAFEPGLYDIGEHTEYAVWELKIGKPPQRLGSFSGVLDIRADFAPVVLGGDLWIGTVAPRRLRVLVFEPVGVGARV